MSTIDRIREKVRGRDYFISSHAEEEMAEDGFERSDVESAILHGRIERKLTREGRGTVSKDPGKMINSCMCCAGSGRIGH